MHALSFDGMLRTPPRLIGRETELARLTTAIDAAASGRASFLLLLGEAGIGKSVLLGATAGLAAERGLRVLAGSAVETGGAIPYLPLVGPLATAVEDAAGQDASSATVRRVVRGEPAVEDPAPHGEDAAASAGAARFIEAVYEVLVRRPTLLIVDDVHWADRSTVTVLEYLSRRAGAVPLVVVAAARDDEPDLVGALSIADGRRFDRVEVQRLDRAEVADQVAALLGQRAQPALVDRLFERSAGNPMFVEELLGADDVGARGRRVIVQFGRPSCARARPGRPSRAPGTRRDRGPRDHRAARRRATRRRRGGSRRRGRRRGPAATRSGVAWRRRPGSGSTSGIRSSARSSPGPCPGPLPAGSIVGRPTPSTG